MIKKNTILVVEDDTDFRGLVTDFLRSKKFVVLEAVNGKEGVTLALSSHPDLILMDLLMPEMDGMAAFGKIREDVWGKDVPVIILTNLNATDEKVIEGVVLGKPAHYLIKSDWHIADIVKKVEDLLKNK